MQSCNQSWDNQSNKSAGFALRDLPGLLAGLRSAPKAFLDCSHVIHCQERSSSLFPNSTEPKYYRINIIALRRKESNMKIPLLAVTVLAGLLPVAVRGGQLPLRYFNCEAGAACRDGSSHGNADYSEDTLGDCAERCDGNNNCNG